MSSPLEITLPYSDVTEFVARFRGVAREGIALPSPFSRKVGETIRFVVRVLDRTIVLEGSGDVADVSDNGRGSPPDSRYDLAIVFGQLTATSDVMLERLILAQEFETTEPTGMRKAPPERPRPASPAPASPQTSRHAAPPMRSSSPPPLRPSGPPPLRTAAPPPVVREREADGDLLEEIDEEDMLTPPPRVLPRAPEPTPPPRSSAPPPLRAPHPSPPPLRPSSPPVRPSSPPARPSSPPGRPFADAGGHPTSPPLRPSSPPARSSMTPLPQAPTPASPTAGARASAREPPPLHTPTPRPAPPRRRTSPGTGEIVAPDMRVETQIDRMPSFDTQTDIRPGAPAMPPVARAPGRLPAPTRAVPAPRTTGGFPAPPPRRKTGQRKAVELPPEPAAEAAPVKAPPRRKTLPGATAAPTRRKTGVGRAVADTAPVPVAPPRRKTGQRRAVDATVETVRPRADQTERTRAPGHASDEEDTDQGTLPPPRRR